MARVMGITLPAGWDIIYNKTLKMYDISVLCNVGKNPRWLPRAKFYNLKEITYLFSIAYAWGLMSNDDKELWNYASNVIGQHNYNLYVQDKSYRIKNGISGNAIPSLYHQFTVGHINISSPATSAKIAQYNFTKVLFPASHELCFHTNLISAGANPFVRCSFIYNRYTSGSTIEDVQTLELPLISGWDKAKQWIVRHAGSIGRWRVELELNDVTGDIWFDNMIVEYSGEIKLNDPYCLDVVKWWKGENIGEGVTFETTYPVGSAL
jgi:hypothetical protein